MRGGVVSFDPVQFDDENQARLRSIAGVTIDSADSIEDALLKQASLPRLCTLDDGAKSEGRLVAAQTTQRLRVRLSVVIIAESWRSKANGKKGALELIRDTKDTIVTRGAIRGEWQNPQCDGPFVFDEWAFMQRNGNRVAYQIDFHADAADDFKR